MGATLLPAVVGWWCEAKDTPDHLTHHATQVSAPLASWWRYSINRTDNMFLWQVKHRLYKDKCTSSSTANSLNVCWWLPNITYREATALPTFFFTYWLSSFLMTQPNTGAKTNSGTAWHLCLTALMNWVKCVTHYLNTRWLRGVHLSLPHQVTLSQKMHHVTGCTLSFSPSSAFLQLTLSFISLTPELSWIHQRVRFILWAQHCVCEWN